MGFGLGSLNPANWSVGGSSLGSAFGGILGGAKNLTNPVIDTIRAPITALAEGDPLYHRLTSGQWDFNPDSNVNRATNRAAAIDPVHRALGISDTDFARTQRIVGGLAGLYFGGAALAGSNSTGTAGGLTPLPEGGMAYTGTVEPGLVGGGYSALPAGGMAATGDTGFTYGLVGGGDTMAGGVAGGVGGTGGSFWGGSTIPSILQLGNTLFGGSGRGTEAAAAADPFASQRPIYQQVLKSLMLSPAGFENTPYFSNLLGTGTEAVLRSNYARGRGNSGGLSADLMKYGQELASENFFEYMKLLLPLSGATTGSPGAAASALTSQGQLDLQRTQAGLGALGNLAQNYMTYLGR